MKKILLIGAEVSDYLNPLAKKFNELGFVVDLLELRKNPKNSVNTSGSYSAVLNFNEIAGKPITIFNAIKYSLTTSFYKNFRKTTSLGYLDHKNSIYKNLKSTLNIQHSSNSFSPLFDKYDIINFHSLTPTTLSYVNYIKPDKKVVLSFWGSDLYQISGIDNYHQQYTAIKRADIITVMSYEMEKIVLAKFGDELRLKIQHTLFGINDELFEKFDNFRKDDTDLNFLNKFNIPENKIKLTIGYSGNPICNHIPTLNELEKIDSSIKEKMHLLVPMTYGNFSDDYREEVRQKLENSKISYTLIDKFLTIDELIRLRLNSDIMLMMNKSDALAQSVSEYIYSGNLVISAVWLPYSIFKMKKIFFYETDFTGLSELVTYSVNNYKDIKTNLSDNPKKVRELTAFSNNWQVWTRIFNSESN